MSRLTADWQLPRSLTSSYLESGELPLLAENEQAQPAVSSQLFLSIVHMAAAIDGLTLQNVMESFDETCDSAE